MKSTSFNTKTVRFSYLHVNKPKAAKGDDKAKYSVMLLIPKTDTETVALLEAACKAAYENEAEGKNRLKGIAYANVKKPLKDGDGFKQDGSEYGPECKGHWIINASSDRKPGLVGTQKDEKGNLIPLTDEDSWYSGIWGRANLNVGAFESKGNRGLAAFLNHLQKVRDDAPLAGGGTAQNAFNDGFEEESLLD